MFQVFSLNSSFDKDCWGNVEFLWQCSFVYCTKVAMVGGLRGRNFRTHEKWIIFCYYVMNRIVKYCRLTTKHSVGYWIVKYLENPKVVSLNYNTRIRKHFLWTFHFDQINSSFQISPSWYVKRIKRCSLIEKKPRLSWEYLLSSRTNCVQSQKRDWTTIQWEQSDDSPRRSSTKQGPFFQLA